MSDHQTHDKLCGTGTLRLEDPALLQGNGQFVGDLISVESLPVIFVRSDVAHGKIKSIDTEQALAQTGVVAIYTGDDLANLNALPVNPVIAPHFLPAFPLLAQSHVDAVGQPLVAIVATSVNRALDAAELVQINIDDQSAATPLNTQEPVFSERWSNPNVNTTGTDPITVSVTISHPRLAPSPIEPRCIAITPSGDDLHINLSTQTPHRARQHLAEILCIDQQHLQVRSPDVGGAFGMKASLYPEEVVAVWIANTLKCAVHWQATRSEDMLSASHGRGTTTHGTLTIDSNGKFHSLHATVNCPLGHWLPNSAAVPAWNAGRILPGPYHVPHVNIETTARLSHTAAVGIYRGAGRPEAAMLMERLVDKAARALQTDPITLRQLNFLQSKDLPHTHCSGARLDTGDYSLGLSTLYKLAQIESLKAQNDKRRSNGELVGLGIACFVEPCGTGWESAKLKCDTNGDLVACIGGSTQGHGRETAYTQILADEFNITADRIKIIHGNTDSCPAGIGALASRSTAIGGSALLAAAQDIKAQLNNSTDHSKSFESSVVYHAAHEAWGSGYYLALVCIDADTGCLQTEKLWCVDEVGQVINPLLTAGQIYGGIAQGLGEAALEQLKYDHNGQLLTGTLTDYALPRASDMPSIVIENITLPTGTDSNLLGAKGVGESGTIGAPAAICNAAIDALSHLGISDLSLPLTSESLWRSMQNAAAKNHQASTS